MPKAINPVSFVKHSSFKSVKWVIVANIVPRISTPLITIVLARILSPTDYGILAVALIIISFVRMFQDLGLGSALIQRESIIDNKVPNVVFWTNLCASILFFGILLICAPSIAIFFKNLKLTLVIRVMSLMIIFDSFGAVQRAILIRKFQFRELFWVQFFPVLSQIVIAIPLAMFGYEYWSLVWAELVKSFLTNCYLWIRSPWRPQISYDKRTILGLLVFGGFVTLESIESWVLNYGDRTFLGHFQDSTDIGIYVLGSTIASLIFGLIINPLLPVAYTAFSHLQNDIVELRRAYLEMLPLIAMICFPLAVGLIIIAEPFTSVFFNDRWAGLDIVISYMAALHGITYLFQFNPNLFKAMNKPDIMPKYYLIMLLYGIPVFWLAAPHGLLIFCLARVLIETSLFPVQVIITKNLLRLSFKSLFNCIQTPLLAVCIMGVIIYPLTHLIHPYHSYMGWLKLGAVIISGMSSYFFALLIIDRASFNSLTKIVKQIVVA